MALGEKLRQARQAAGMTQRQLCGDKITRNMLSQIEKGTATPSMGTLRYLAGRLGRPLSYFLEEEAEVSPNEQVMRQARNRFDLADYAGAAAALEGYREPDPLHDREKKLLWVLTCQELARQAIAQQKYPYARELLEKAAIRTPYAWEELERRRLLLLGSIPGEKVCDRLPSLDRELLLRAQEALAAGTADRAEKLLEAAENQETPRWNLLRGQVHLALGKYAAAVPCLERAEESFPDQAVPRLERCWRELGDYKRAYEYACKGREK